MNIKENLLANILKDNFVRNVASYLKVSFADIAKELSVHKQTVSNWNSSYKIDTRFLAFAVKNLDSEALHAMLSGHFEYYQGNQSNEENSTNNSN